MSKQATINQPATIQDEPWMSFPKLAYSFINDGFVHDHQARLKINLRTANGGAQIKETISNGQKGHLFSDETKFWFSLPDSRSFFAKFKTGQNIKIHYDNGSTELFGKTFNLYATLNLSRQINHLSWRIGAAHLGSHCHSDNRIRLDTGDHHKLVWYNRTSVTKGKFNFGFLATYDFINHLVGKNSLLLGMNIDKRSSVHLRAQNDKFRSTPIKFDQWRNYFDHILLDIINKYDAKTQIGLEFAFQAHGKPFKQAVIVVQRELNEQWTSKYKLSSNFDVNLLFRTNKFFPQQNGKLSLGLHATNLHRPHRRFNYGVQLQFDF